MLPALFREKSMASIRSAFHLTRLAAIGAVLICATRQPVDAASFVTRGVTTVANSATTVAPTAAGVGAGNSLIVTVHVASLGGTIACSDPINGAYNTDVVSPAGAGAGIASASKHNVAALSFGDVITCTVTSKGQTSRVKLKARDTDGNLDPVNT